jgi:hypothetical protein
MSGKALAASLDAWNMQEGGGVVDAKVEVRGSGVSGTASAASNTLDMGGGCCGGVRSMQVQQLGGEGHLGRHQRHR